MSKETDAILVEIQKEREYQIERWGNQRDDQENAPNDWVAYISHHASRWFTGGFKPYNTNAVNDYRKQMIKVATLAVAAIESLDRLRDNPSTKAPWEV